MSWLSKNVENEELLVENRVENTLFVFNLEIVYNQSF